MTLTDHDLVMAAAATYDPTAKPYVSAIDGSVNVFVTSASNAKVVAIEGTHDPLGWSLDFMAIRATEHNGVDNKLGWLHAGFLAAATNILPPIYDAVAGKEFYLTGHSLGAALVLLIGAMLADAGHPPKVIGAFAPPRVGDAAFVKVVSGLRLAAYRYGSDVVPTVPLTLEPMFPYRQINLTPIGPPSHDGFADHNIKNYVAAVPLN